MVLPLATAKALLAGGLILAAAEAPSAPADRGSLYLAVSGVVVSVVSAYGLITASRSKTKEIPAAPFVVDDSLTDELTGLYADAERRAAKAEYVAEMWKARAISRGWPEDQA